VPKKEETFASRLQDLRESAGLSQYRLAQLSAVSKQTLSRLELGTAQPSWDTVQALARGLGIDVGAFVIDKTAPVPADPARPRGRPRKE
jgi:transcriptional regulator with XRE-family HTH domain